jgi:hypothetical protein
MASRIVNPDRIRRHRARSTPDTVEIWVDPIDDNIEEKYLYWMVKFTQAMRIKHGEHVEIAIFSEPGFSSKHPFETRYFAEAVLKRKKENNHD